MLTRVSLSFSPWPTSGWTLWCCEWLSGDDLAGEVSAGKNSATDVGLGYKNGTERPRNCAEMITVGKHIYPDKQVLAKNALLAEIKKEVDKRYGIWISCSGPGVLRIGIFCLIVKAMAAEIRLRVLGWLYHEGCLPRGGLISPVALQESHFCVKISHLGWLCWRGGPRTWRWFQNLLSGAQSGAWRGRPSGRTYTSLSLASRNEGSSGSYRTPRSHTDPR